MSAAGWAPVPDPWRSVVEPPANHRHVWLRAPDMPPTTGWRGELSKTFYRVNPMEIITPTEWLPIVADQYPWGAFPE
jgi:hypothetical protein